MWKETPSMEEMKASGAEQKGAEKKAGNSEVATALSESRHRPVLTIRARILLSFLLFLGLCVLLTAWSIWVSYKIEDKIRFLEIADGFMAEIQQARRFEKNFLLYGTNIQDALQHLQQASHILQKQSETTRKFLGEEHFESMVARVNTYRRLLTRLGKSKNKNSQSAIEPILRRHGGQLVSFAQDFVKKERESVQKMLGLAQRAPFVFLAVLMLLVIFITVFLNRYLLSTLQRFMAYTRRIGEGDFSSITPVKKYRDEFSELAEAFNRMIEELERRHNILVESHKLRAIGTLVAGVAHELNNPLNNMMLTAALLEEDFDAFSEEEKREMLGDLISETERSQKIVRNLLDFARQSEANVEPLHIAQILEDSIRLVSNQVKMSKIRLEVDISQELPPVHGDEQMLKQVFVNLMLNSIDVLPPKGTMYLTTDHSERGGFLEVEIRDNGPGIPEHHLSRIFEPFFTTKRKGKGTGLGLSVTRGIVRKLGGLIQVSSKVGVGTVFKVLLPITETPSEISSGRNSSHP